MIKALLLPYDDDSPVTRVEFDAEDVHTMQGHVGGNFEVYNFDTPAVSIFANDEAMLWPLPHNHRATILLWQHAVGLRGRAYIAGNAVLTGQTDGRGRTKSVPEEFFRLLMETERYSVEMMHNPRGAWRADSAGKFDNWVEAYNYALIQERTYATIHRTRVVPA